MYRLFPLIIFFLSLFSAPLSGRTYFSEGCPRNVISNLPECIANAVFEGKDADMPEGAEYDIAIEPIRDKKGNTIMPNSIAEALHAMHEMLPHWYLNALRRSRGNDECSVTVNGDSYAGLVSTWLWVHWKMEAKDSKLRKQFAELGIHENPEVEQAIIFGFCALVKDGEQKALDTIKQRGASAGGH